MSKLFKVLGFLACAIMIVYGVLVGDKETENSNNKMIDHKYVIKLYQHQSKKVALIPLDTYLIHVVAAEMPASFHSEAIKAQAIAARTYVIHKVINGANPLCEGSKQGAIVCDSPQHAQVWISNQELKSRWGRQYEERLATITEAIKATDGLILTDNNKRVIDPLYHSNCGGTGTASAKDVFGREVSYLKGVVCNGEHPDKDVSLKVTSNELVGKVAKVLPVGTASKKFGIFTSSKGSLLSIVVAGEKISVRQIREIFKLPSTTIYVKQTGNDILLTSKGAGHGVGMCQFGTNNLAKEGKDYQQILKHYYSNINIIRIGNLE